MIRSILLVITFFFVSYAQPMNKFETSNFSVNFTVEHEEEDTSAIDIKCSQCKESLVHYNEATLTQLANMLKNDDEWKSFLHEIITTIKDNHYIQGILENLEWRYGFKLKTHVTFREEDLDTVQEIINTLVANCYFCHESNEPQFHSFCLNKLEKCTQCKEKIDRDFLLLLRPPTDINFGKKSIKNDIHQHKWLKTKTIKEFNASLLSAEKNVRLYTLCIIYLCCIRAPVILFGSLNNHKGLIGLVGFGSILFVYFMMFTIGATGNDRPEDSVTERALLTAKDLNVPLRWYFARLRNNHRLNFYDIETKSSKQDDEEVMSIEEE
jgi:hypothetical protein